MHKHSNLENRLISFASATLELAEKLVPQKAGSKVLKHQISKSCTASALIYGEAMAAESRKDFIHKMSLALKELRETHICLKIITNRNLLPLIEISELMDETNQLISIFVASIKTASQNLEST